MRIHIKKSGFIALMSVIIISAVLVLVAVVANFRSFYGRSNVLLAEYKERSVALSEGCVEHALLQIANGGTYTANTDIKIGNYVCTISPITGSTVKTFKTRGVFQNSYTNLEISVNSSNMSVQSWKEIKNF